MAPERRLAEPEARCALDRLHDRQLNYDATRSEELTPERGWNVDDYRQPLPPEAPGPPAPRGSWEVARRLMRDYEFADPSMVRAVRPPHASLEPRDLLLVLNYHGLRFRVGVRVGGARDETREVEGRAVRVWGWSYRTLQGHLEMGQMDYELWKWLDSGEVEFRIHRVSKAARFPNPIVRLGFALLGRRQQIRFARRACARMARLTAAELGHPGADPVPRTAGEIAVGGTSAPRGLSRARAGSRGCRHGRRWRR